jgi:hypothetical protein
MAPTLLILTKPMTLTVQTSCVRGVEYEVGASS